MFKVLKTNEFDEWLSSQPQKTRAILNARLDMISIGHWGDHKRFDGLIELRWKNGNRVYSFMWSDSLVVALYGGNKNAQNKDIRRAKSIRNEILEGTRAVLKS